MTAPSRKYRRNLGAIPPVHEDTAYRGYLIRHNPLNGLRWVEKDGVRIASCVDLESGRRMVDALLDWK